MSTVPGAVRDRSIVETARRPLTLVTDRFTLVVPPSVFTMAGFREWATADDFPDGVRATYLAGEVLLDMSNEEINSHVGVKAEVIRVLGNVVKEAKLGKFYGDGVLVTNVSAEVANNPDALFLSRATIESAKARLIPRRGAEHLYRELEGTPDCVIEVVSDGSVKKDTVKLREAYHRAGIPEYWLIDARKEELSFSVLLRRKNGYVSAPNKDGWLRSKVFSRSFRLVRYLDDFGLWEYTLETVL